jgi:hypothetical protein
VDVEVCVKKTRIRVGRLAVVVTIGAFGCGGGGGSPTGGTGTQPTPTPSASTIVQPTPTPTPSSGPTASSCPLGKGTVSTQCARSTPSFLADVDAAIDQLVLEKPEIFDTRDLAGPREYKVKDVDAYYKGVAAILRTKGFCSDYDLVELQVKNTNDFNDQYDILISQGYVRRGAGSYRNTCSPAAFPLDPEDVIAQVRVAFFGFRCLDESKVPPRNGEGKIPVNCFGNVTASPKNKDGHDVDSRIHGEQIQWVLSQEDRYVRVDDQDGVPFNKVLFGQAPGHFSLCATVRGIQGCLNGEVIP